jgi:hypothetical protein
MHGSDIFRAFTRATPFIAASLLLSGCLAEEEAEEVAASPPVQNVAPEISGNPATAVLIGDMYSFTPSASDADNDPLTFEINNKPNWLSFDNSNGALTGQATFGDIGLYRNIRISVSDGQANVELQGFDISVDQAGNVSTTLSWSPPTQNSDGSPLMDLAGYKIYWGTTPGNYSRSVTLNNPGLTSYVVDNLVPGTYEFVATSFNTNGMESAYSSPVTRVLN